MRRVALWVAAAVLAGGVPQVAAGAGPEGALQVVALEAARQQMVAAQLAEMVDRFGDLLGDLSSNRAVSADVTKIASALRDRLVTVQRVRLAHARSLLDQALRAKSHAPGRLAEAQGQIELAARELGSLLLQAGVSQACEVFATELRELIARQELLLAVAGGPEEGRQAAAAQRGLAERVAALLAEIRQMQDAPADALAVVHLARARKIVELAAVVGQMRQAAAALVEGPHQAADSQARALRGLRQGLLKLRPDARLEELVQARNVLGQAGEAQKALRTSVALLDGADLAARKAGLKLRQEAITRPLRQLVGSPEIEPLIAAAVRAGKTASEAIGSADAPAAAAAQGQVEAALAAAVLRLGGQIARLRALDETHKRMLDAADRMKSLGEIRDRAEQIKNSAFDAASEGKGLDGPAAAQEQVARDIGAFVSALPPRGAFAPAMRRPLRKASQATDRSARAMKTGKLEAAMPDLAKAEQALKEGMDVAKREMSMLEKLWLFRQASADIKLIRQDIEDVEGEQADLRSDTEAAANERRTVLDFTAPQAMLARATQQVQDIAGAIREAAPMKPPLDAALAAMNQAAAQLEKDLAGAALALQKQALAALRDSRRIATGLIIRIDLIVLEIDASLELSSRAMDLLQRQIVLRETTEEAPEADLRLQSRCNGIGDLFRRLAGEQDILLAETEVLTGISVVPKAVTAFQHAAAEMKGAIAQLQAVARAPAVEHQKKAEDALRAGILALDEYILSLMDVLGGGAFVQEYITAMDGLTAILLLATEQRELRELTVRTPEAVLPMRADKQEEFRGRATVISQMPHVLTGTGRITGWEHIEAAAAAMAQAVTTLKASARDETVAHQQRAEKELRIAFAMNVVELIMALQPPPPGNPDAAIPVTLRDAPVLISLDHWFEFSKADPLGKLPQTTKSEWNSLVDRERAALNENFARELPLEFRRLLKDYYEALAR